MITTAQARQAAPGGRQANVGAGRKQKAKRAVFKSTIVILASVETVHKARQAAPREALSAAYHKPAGCCSRHGGVLKITIVHNITR